MKKPRLSRRRLSRHQKETLRILAEQGVRISFLAKVTRCAEGVALSTTYPHVSPNSVNYTYRVKRNRLRLKEYLKEQIREKVDAGNTTREISDEWGVPLGIVNKILVQ
jgi:hypothetical protein